MSRNRNKENDKAAIALHETQWLINKLCPVCNICPVHNSIMDLCDWNLKPLVDPNVHFLSIMYNLEVKHTKINTKITIK